MVDPLNKQIIDEIIQLYHPGTTIKYKVGYLYSWITIIGKGIGIGIEFVIPYFGEGWKLEDFVKVYDTSNFKAWRFYDDGKDLEVNDTDDIDVNPILAKFNVPRPTPTQMFDYYYED